ncbi:swr1 complex component [Coemansia sp. Benny D115]|nr:swr1 complex component [Coemansia sp. Benny D115]
MSEIGSCQSVRGRRRGRPPGIQTTRSTSALDGAQELLGCKRKHLVDYCENSNDSGSDQNSGSERENKLAKQIKQEHHQQEQHQMVPVDDGIGGSGGVRGRGRGRGRGRPPSRAAKFTRVDDGGVNKTAGSKASSRSGSPKPPSAPAPAAYPVVDPWMFVNRVHSAHHASKASGRRVDQTTKELSVYLSSFITTFDDSVFSSLPRAKQPTAKRLKGAMTLPTASTETRGSQARDEARARQRLEQERIEREQQMQHDLAAWVDDMAAKMYRISELRRGGLLRDSPEISILPHIDSNDSGKGCGVLIPMARLLPPAQPLPPPKALEPKRNPTSWDQLLCDICDRHKALKAETKRRRMVLRKRGRLIERNEDERQARLGIFRRPEAAERAQREHERKLAKWTVQQVMRKWAYVESVVLEKRQMEEQEERAREGKQALFSMLERSTRMLEEQQADLLAPATAEASESSSGSEDTDGDDGDDDADNDGEGRGEITRHDSDVGTDGEGSGESNLSESDEDEMADLRRDQDVPMEDILEQYRLMNLQQGLATGDSTLQEESSSPPHCDSDVDEAVKTNKEGGDSKGGRMRQPQMQQPSLLRGQLREYQQQGLAWLAALHDHQTNGILADEMGLGKTIQTIAFLAHLACNEGIWGPHLVIVPTSVLMNWEQEFHRWLPGLKVLTYYGSRAERKQRRRGWSKLNAFHVCVTSYQLAIQDASVFKRKQWHCMVLDEAQAIKNFRSQRWQTLLGFRSASRLLLTGTPLQNSLLELWSLMYFLMPAEFNGETAEDGGGSGGFAGLDRFREWFAQPLEKLLAAQPEIAAPATMGAQAGRGVEFNTAEFLQNAGSSSGGLQQSEAQQAVQKLHAVLRPHILRRLKQDVETQLPNKTEHVIYCHLSKRQRFLYDDFMARSQTRETLRTGSYLGVMGCLMQLRKVCNHPDLFETRPIVTSWVVSGAPVARYRRCEDLVRGMLGGGSLGDYAKPWEPGADIWGIRGLLVAADQPSKDDMAWESARRLDASPRMLQKALQCSRSALLDVSAAAESEWDQLQMRPVSTRRLRAAVSVAEANRQQLCKRRVRRQETLMRLAKQNIQRIHGMAHKPVYSAGTLARCTIVRDIRERWIVAGADAAAADLLPTPAQRLEWYRPLVENFVFVTPPVVVANTSSDLEAVYPHLRAPASLSLPVVASDSGSAWVQEVRPNILHMRRRVLHRTGLLRPIEVRQQIAFPEPFLLQYDCGKLQALDRLLSVLVREGHRALIFTQMTRVLDILEQWLNLHGYRYLRLDGATKVEQRWRLTERFNHDPRWSVFISSTRAGGLGINLTGADTVIFYDSDWNHAMDAQCQDRCHRIGQQREVRIYRLISEKTIEEAIWRKQCEKRWLNQVVIQEGHFDHGSSSTRSTVARPNNAAAAAAGMSGSPSAALGVGDWYDLAGSMLAEANDSAARQMQTGVASRTVMSDHDAARMLTAAEDAVDAAALKVAITEVAQADALDLGSEELTATPVQPESGVFDTPAHADSVPAARDASDESDEEDDGIGHIDDYMLRFVSDILFNQAVF